MKEALTKRLDRFISVLPKPVFNFYMGIMAFFDPNLGDILDNSNVTTQNGKTVITRHDGHIFIDSRGIVTYEKTR